MRHASPPKLWLFTICLLPGATILVAASLRAPLDRRQHRHEWRPYRSPGGVMRLVDDRGRPMSRLRPDEVARIVCLPVVDMDRCARPDRGCSLAPEGIVVEDSGPRVLGFDDGGAGGAFGTRVADGRFQPLPPAEHGRATHYRAGGERWGTFGFTALFDDTAHAQEHDGTSLFTFDDPPQESAPLWIEIGPRP